MSAATNVLRRRPRRPGRRQEIARLVLAGAAWTAVWLVLDLAWGGLIAADFNTSGLQQAYSLLLFVGGWLVVAFVLAVRALKGSKRRSAGAR